MAGKRKSLHQLVEKHRNDAVYAENKAAEWRAKAEKSRKKAAELADQILAAAEALT